MADEMIYNEAGTHVYMRNPENDQIWESPPDAVPYMKARGWELASPPEQDDSALFDSTAEGDEQTGFDPAKHTADEVSEHLALHAESAPGEVERVLGLERAGKNRKSVAVPDGFEPVGE